MTDLIKEFERARALGISVPRMQYHNGTREYLLFEGRHDRNDRGIRINPQDAEALICAALERHLNEMLHENDNRFSYDYECWPIPKDGKIVWMVEVGHRGRIIIGDGMNLVEFPTKLDAYLAIAEAVKKASDE